MNEKPHHPHQPFFDWSLAVCGSTKSCNLLIYTCSSLQLFFSNNNNEVSKNRFEFEIGCQTNTSCLMFNTFTSSGPRRGGGVGKD